MKRKEKIEKYFNINEQKVINDIDILLKENKIKESLDLIKLTNLNKNLLQNEKYNVLLDSNQKNDLVVIKNNEIHKAEQEYYLVLNSIVKITLSLIFLSILGIKSLSVYFLYDKLFFGNFFLSVIVSGFCATTAPLSLFAIFYDLINKGKKLKKLRKELYLENKNND